MTPGVVMLWSGSVPRLELRAIPPEGLLIGRDTFESHDDRLSRRHVFLRHIDDWLIARDLGSRHGSLVNGLELPTTELRMPFPAVFRLGRTVGVAVRDLAPYQDAGDAPVLARARQAVDDAARADDCTTIEGPLRLTAVLARRYAEQIGGETVVFQARAQLPLAAALDKRTPRTIILDLVGHSLVLADVPTLAGWLETDVRFVTLIRPGEQPLSLVTAAMLPRLQQRVIRVWPRYETLGPYVVQQVAELLPGAPIHASVLEVMALALDTHDESAVERGFQDTLRVRGERTDPLRGDEVRTLLYEDPDPAICYVPEMRHPRRQS